MMKSVLGVTLGCAVLCGCVVQQTYLTTARPKTLPKHVVFVGFDGLGGRYVGQAEAPTLKAMMEAGSWTLKGRTILPSGSACNWHSLYTCSASEQHGFDNWNTKKPVFDAAMTGANGLYPDIYSEMRRQRPDAETGYVYEWDGMGFVVDTNACSYSKYIGEKAGAQVTTDAACAYLRAKKPVFLSVVYDRPDGAGHRHGWGSPEYLADVKMLDGQLAQIVKTLKEIGIYDDTVIVVSSDHGGVKKEHGHRCLECIERTFVVCGPGIKSGEIPYGGAIYDAGATMAALLGLDFPVCWIGRPYDVFCTSADFTR